jgi:preprotein translocase subunit SecF
MEFFRIRRTIPFMRHALVFNIISLVVFVLSVGLLAVKGLHLSIEFLGGTVMEVNYAKPPDLEKLRTSLVKIGLTDVSVQSFGTTRDVLIRLPLKVALDKSQNVEMQKQADAVMGVLKGDDATAELKRVEFVGSQVGKELATDGALALLFVSLGIVIYLAFRFEWRFGLSSILATAHDVLGTVIFISVLHLEVSLVVVGAVLSVLGLSLNETIIIFDRVRENERHRRYPDLRTTLNRSINETLPRTVLTHGTSLATMMTLAIFGGEVIRPFALVMFFGVFTGIFSSMFIAPAMLLYIRRRWPPIGAAAPRSTRAPAGRAAQPVA